MSEEKCKFYKKQFLNKYCELFKQPCYGKHCNFIKEFTRLNELEQQLQTAKEENKELELRNDKLCLEVAELAIELQTAKEENEKLMEQLNTKYLEWEEKFMENQNLTQQNKQMREAINNIKNLCNEDWEDMAVDKFQNQLLQALKGVE